MGASDIRAGRAFVEVSTDDKTQAGLAKIQARLRTWSASLQHLGETTRGGELPEPLAAVARFAASPAGLFSGLLAANHAYAESGAAMLEMAERAGTSVEAISAMSYAAQRCGVDSSELAAGLRKMQVAIYNAAKGGDAASNAMRTLGINLAALRGKSTEDQFSAIAGAISRIDDPTRRAAAATEIFGRGGAALLPLLVQGSAGIDAFSSRARELGLVMDESMARKAKESANLWADLKAVMSSAVRVIGSEVTPLINGMINAVIKATVAVRDWLKEHKGLAAAALIGTGGIIALGTAATFTSFAMGALASVAGTVSAVLSAISLLASPWVLLGAAVVAATGYVLYATGAFKSLGQWLSSTFANVISEIVQSFGAIGRALAAGDIAAAWKVTVAAVKLEWTRLCNNLEDYWRSFKSFWDAGVSGIAIGLINASARIRSVWADMLNWMSKQWTKFSNSTFTEGLTNLLAPIAAKLTGQKTEDVRKQLGDMFKEQRAAQAMQFSTADAETEKEKQRIEDDRKAQTEIIAADQARRDNNRAKEGDAEANLRHARAEWEKARNEANAAATATKEAAISKRRPDFGMDLGSFSASGTFSSFGAWGLGTGGPVQEIAHHTQMTVEKLEALLRKAQSGGLVFE